MTPEPSILEDAPAPSPTTTTFTSLSPLQALGQGMQSLRREPRWGILLVLLLLLLVQPTIWLTGTWFDWHSPFFAQPLVLLGALLIGYSRRDEVEKTARELAELFPPESPKRRGNVAVVVFGGMIALMGHVLRMDFVAILGFVVVFTGIIFYFYGPFVLKSLGSALFFLCFLIPLPKTVTGLLQVGFQNGTYSCLSPFFKTNSFNIETGNFVMAIDALASGLHLFIPLAIFCLGWALYKRYSLYNTLIMLALSTLLSLFVNVFRVMLTCWLGSANPDIGGFLSRSTPLLLTLPIAWVVLWVARLVHQRQELRASMRSSVTG
jgi:exosortase/archaeosortase family protein